MKTVLAGAAALALIAAPAAFAQPQDAAPAAAAAAKLSSNSTLSALAKDAKAKEVLAKHIPQIAEFLFSGQAEGVLPPETTLKALADIPQAVDAGLSPEALKKIDEDLAKL